MSNSIINGIVVTITDDFGPKPTVNISPLDEVLSNKLAMIGMTVLMLGNSDPTYFSKRHNKILGPLPIPFDNQMALISGVETEMVEAEAVAIIFNVKVDLKTDDQRALEYGREAIAWFIFNSADRDKIFSITKKIEEISKLYLEKIKVESQLTNEKFFKEFFEKVKEETSEIDISGSTEKYQPEAIKYAQYTLYKFDFEKEKLVPIQALTEIKNLELLIFVDLPEKQINMIQFKNVPERKLFQVSKAITNLNLSLKREFTVRNINDQFEIMMYMEKLDLE
jgi:hypothetical protein